MPRILFPGTLLVLVLAIVGCAPTAMSPSPVASAPEIAVRVADFSITPAEVAAAIGPVAFAVANDGPTPHNLTVRDAAGTIALGTNEIRPGATQRVAGSLTAGRYVLFCSLPGHESLGMRAMLVVGG